jgi:hypothetical protein
MKMFTDKNNCHVSNGFSYSYFKITTNKSAINIVNWNYAVSTNIIKIGFPEFNITTAIIICNPAFKSGLLINCR